MKVKISLLVFTLFLGLLFSVSFVEAGDKCFQCKCICEWGQAYISHEWDNCLSLCEGVFGNDCDFDPPAQVEDYWCSGGPTTTTTTILQSCEQKCKKYGHFTGLCQASEPTGNCVQKDCSNNPSSDWSCRFNARTMDGTSCESTCWCRGCAYPCPGSGSCRNCALGTCCNPATTTSTTTTSTTTVPTTTTTIPLCSNKCKQIYGSNKAGTCVVGNPWYSGRCNILNTPQCHYNLVKISGTNCVDYCYCYDLESCGNNYNECNAQCTANGCEPSCQSHSSYQCYSDDAYWYDSCGVREDKKQECGTSGYTGSDYCYDNDVYQDYVDRGCSGSLCFSNTNKVKQYECGSSGCSGGQCITPTTTTTTIYCSQGWKCYSSSYKGYQHSDCSWTSKEYCLEGCENGYCKQVPTTTTTSSTTTSSTTTSSTTSSTTTTSTTITACPATCNTDRQAVENWCRNKSDYCNTVYSSTWNVPAGCTCYYCQRCDSLTKPCYSGCETPTTTTTTSSTTTTTQQYCTQGWKCYNSVSKGYQHSDCSWANLEYCQYGCENGYCRQVPTTTTTIPDQDYCYLSIYVWEEEDHDSLNAYIYVDGSYKGYDNHLVVQVTEGSHTVRAEKSGYYSDQESVSCWDGQTGRVDLYLEEYNGNNHEEEVIIISTDVDPDEICDSSDRTIELSSRVKLEQGEDDTYVTVRFYVEDDGNWEYIASDSERLDEDETKTFEVNYYYDDGDLEPGTHEIKVVAEAGDERDVKYGYLDVEDCFDGEDYDVDVRDVVLDPQNPNRCQTVLATSSIELKDAEDFPENVYVKAYIDNNLEYSTTIKFYDEEIRVFKFTFDTCDLDIGTHNVRVEARLGDVTDSISKSFSVDGGHYYFDDYKRHCLDIEKIWTDKPIQPDEDVKVFVRIVNCGTETESGMRANLETFGMIQFDGMFNLPKGGSREIAFNIHVPEDAAGTESFVAKTWSSYTSDVLVKDFAVYTGMPLIDIEKEYKVETCEIQKIKFDVINAGEIIDTFDLELTGPASEWMTGLPQQITLEPDQRKTVEVYVAVPCGVEEGYYQFTAAAHGSPRYAVTSTLRVVEGFKWPSLTGMFVFVGWLPWLLLALLLLALFLFLLWLLFGKRTGRRGLPEGHITKFFKFDDCC